MIPPRFEYYAPASVDEAIGLLDRFGGEAKLLAGGQSLVPLLKLRLAAPKAVVDLNHVPGLSYVREEGDALRIGALTRTNDLLDSELVRTSYPILSDAAATIADPLVRNLGTVGGNVAHGDPANDLPACMVALRAAYAIRGPGGTRTVPAEVFYLDTFATVLASNEVLTEIQVPRAKPGRGGAYEQIERRTGDFPTAGVAAVLEEARGGVEDAGIALTAVGPTVIRAREAEDSLRGRPADEPSFRRAAELARDAAKPVADLRGSVAYKREIVAKLTLRALQRAQHRARGGE